MKPLLILPLIAVCSFSASALAQSHDHHHGHTAEASATPDKIDIYAPVMEKMHKDMMITPTGDADADFVLGMIPHHQGAVDMALILKEHGKDPELQKLADEIIAAQEKEITFMKAWLEKNGH